MSDSSGCSISGFRQGAIEAFDEVFVKRGDAETPDSHPTGVFEELFVRRGRWRKSPANSSPQSHRNVVHLAGRVGSGFSDVECLVPSLSDVTYKTKPSESMDQMFSETCSLMGNVSPMLSELPGNTMPFVIKNTFIAAPTLQYDSLKEFLQERRIQSCPVSRSVYIDDIIGGEMDIDDAHYPLEDVVFNTDDAIFNTDSTFADVDAPDQREIAKLEEVFNTDSTFVESDDVVRAQLSSSDTGHELPWDASTGFDNHSHHLATDIAESAFPHAFCQGSMRNTAIQFVDERADSSMSAFHHCVADKLRHLRMKGSQIKQRIADAPLHQEIHAKAVSNLVATERQDLAMEVAFDHQPLHWQEATRMTDRAMNRLSSQALQQPQQHFFPAPPGKPPSMTAPSPSPPPPPPPAPPPFERCQATLPVLRLAETLPLPKQERKTLLSVGSMLHEKGQCRPCSFFHTRGCENGEACPFCHLCGPGEKKKRLRAHRLAKRMGKLAAMHTATEIVDDLDCFSDAEEAATNITSECNSAPNGMVEGVIIE